MNFEGFLPHEITKFCGAVDILDGTSLPLGVAALCKNCRFALTGVKCRYGFQTQMQSPNADAQITGLLGGIYTPENLGEVKFQVPMAFDTDGFLLKESPVGTGRMVRIQGPLVTLPDNSQMIGTQAENHAFMAFSDLMSQTAPMAVYDLKRAALEPFAQKPFGWNWIKSTGVLVGEYATPSIVGGNGHLYRCIVAGTTGLVEPTWPTADNATFTDGTATWQELTPVIANTVPPPAAPVVTAGGGGTLVSGLDVYVIVSLVNPKGETLGGMAGFATTLIPSTSSVSIPNPTLASLPAWVQELPTAYRPTGFNVYVAGISHGGPAPPQSIFMQFGGTTPLVAGTTVITGSGTGNAPLLVTTARITPAGLQPPDGVPPVERLTGGGAFPAGRDVYIIATASDTSGETLPGVPGILVDTVLSDAATLMIPGTAFQVTGITLYEADVPTGDPAPPTAAYAKVGVFQPNTTATITTTAAGAPPPTVSTAGNGGNIAANPVGTLRYASFEFVNNNENFSGFTNNSVISGFFDAPGFEIYTGRLPIGPGNIKARITNFTIAAGTNAGPFFYIPSATLTSPVTDPADLVDGIYMTATRVNDSTSTNATFDFTDVYLVGNVLGDNTDRFRVVQPPPAVDVYYSPSINRLILTGCDGMKSGHFISLESDLESYYDDTSRLLVAQGDGEETICAREYAGTLYSLKERSGHIISPDATDPSTWDVQRRWTGQGPCGPRAVDVCQDFMIFAHRSGLYAFTGSEPELITTELPNSWQNINWDAQQTIWICIDTEAKEIRIGIPLGNSTVPNKCWTMNYFEGEGKAIHFSAYVGKETALVECRKWSLDDVAANCMIRCERQLPENASQFGSFRQSQILFGSSSPDGTVQGIVPGVYRDNQMGIDQQYETVAQEELLAVNMLGGVGGNFAVGGQMDVSVMVGKVMKTSPGQGRQGPQMQTNEIKLAPCFGPPTLYTKYSAGGRGQNESFRLRLTNGKRPDNFFEATYANIYARPIFSGRTSSGQ